MGIKEVIPLRMRRYFEITKENTRLAMGIPKETNDEKLQTIINSTEALKIRRESSFLETLLFGSRVIKTGIPALDSLSDLGFAIKNLSSASFVVSMFSLFPYNKYPFDSVSEISKKLEDFGYRYSSITQKALQRHKSDTSIFYYKELYSLSYIHRTHVSFEMDLVVLEGIERETRRIREEEQIWRKKLRNYGYQSVALSKHWFISTSHKYGYGTLRHYIPIKQANYLYKEENRNEPCYAFVRDFFAAFMEPRFVESEFYNIYRTRKLMKTFNVDKIGIEKLPRVIAFHDFLSSIAEDFLPNEGINMKYLVELINKRLSKAE